MEVDLERLSNEKPDLTNYDTALDLLYGLSKFIKLREETIPLQTCTGRVLGGEIKALIDNPPTDVSAMDGYAINSLNGSNNGILRVIGVAAAGRPTIREVKPNNAIRVFTGAKLPKGANTIIIQEEVTNIEDDKIKINDTRKILLADNIRKKGSDFTKGTRIEPGVLISPREVMLFAAMGHKKVTVRTTPKISIITVGDELIPPGNIYKENHIYSSNAFGINALLQKFSCQSVIMPIARDNLKSLKKSLHKACEKSDIIVTSGGASVGEYDLVREAATELGLQLSFEKVNVRPGKPTFAGHLNEVPLIGLPGNPVSSYICAQIFLIPLIMRVTGCKGTFPTISTARLGSALKPNGTRKHYMRANLAIKHGRQLVYPKERQDSSLIRTLQDANCLIVRPPNDSARYKNDVVDIIDLV